jgi:hypothetical protein
MEFCRNFYTCKICFQVTSHSLTCYRYCEVVLGHLHSYSYLLVLKLNPR